jgi:predicted regulator of Ras-like GTPase activity (Roadblock/LC7/MglB family)/Tfp pilus assembly protein PilF
MADEIQRLSDELARDPSSMAFLRLAEALRHRGQMDLALKVTMRGLERHPHNADAHDLLARIAVDRGELQRAFDEWDMVLRLVPAHIGARKGMGFVCFQQGRVTDAERYLGEAAAADPGDQTIATALAHIRAGHATAGSAQPTVPQLPVVPVSAPPESASATPPSVPHVTAAVPQTPRSPRMLFADLIGDEQQTVLLLDADGLVMAGAYVDADGKDVAEEIGAQLSGVSEEARRAMRHLGLGDWSSITFETEAAVIAMAPAPQDALLLVAAARELPLGLVGRLRERSLKRAASWMEGT